MVNRHLDFSASLEEELVGVDGFKFSNVWVLNWGQTFGPIIWELRGLDVRRVLFLRQ